MICRRLAGPIGSDSGQAMVEFALVLPVILLLLIGMLEFSRAWNLHQAMTEGVREGARRAALADGLVQPEAEDSVRAAIWRAISLSGVPQSVLNGQSVIENPGDLKITGRNITIKLDIPYRFFVLPGPGITMHSKFTMRNE